MISRWFSIAAAMLLLSAAPALAETVRVPDTGAPAITLEAPDGWKSDLDEGSLQLEAADGSGFVQVAVMPRSELPGGDFARAAADLMAAIKAAPYSKRETVRYGGLTGEAFTSQLGSGSQTMDVRVVFLSLGSSDVVVATDLRKAGLNSTQLRTYGQVYESLKAAKP